MKKLTLLTLLGALISFSVILPKEANARGLSSLQVFEFCHAIYGDAFETSACYNSNWGSQ